MTQHTANIGLAHAQAKMRQAGMTQTAIDVFSDHYRQLSGGTTGIIDEESIMPFVDVDELSKITISEQDQRDALARTVVIRLNGGLATSMGLEMAKSLLPVRGNDSFLAVIAHQLRYLRQTTGAALPIVLMNSFRTSADTHQAISKFFPDLLLPGLPWELRQNSSPKICCEDLLPVSWPANRDLEWCPPGHGDIYTSLWQSGLLEKLLEQGYRYAMAANIDNLGAIPDGRIAAWFAHSGAAYCPELCHRTAADVKGGHLAIRRSDAQLILRETAQTAECDLKHFTDQDRHPYAHTNNIWFDLQILHRLLTDRKGVLQLPLIRNRKNVDPTNPASPAVYQLETAMGAAIQVFPTARPLLVGRDRFLPVKTTNDLLLLRSDVYTMEEDHRLRLSCDTPPLINLDQQFYGTLKNFEARFPAGPPSLRQATSLTVRGDWTFEADVTLRDEVVLPDAGLPSRVPKATVW